MRLAVRGLLVGALTLSLHAGAADVAAVAGMDVRLVIDVSGSMKSGDPEYLRQDVLNGLGEMLAPGSRAGVWTFGGMADVVVPHGVVDDAWRRTARAARTRIGSTAARTDLYDALRKATWDVGVASPDFHRHIILVTDGRVDVADDAVSNDSQRRAISEELVPKLVEANIEIDCLALSPNADIEFLKRIADATHGHVARADTVSAVKQYLATVVERIAPSGSFTVAPDTAEVTLFADRSNDPFVLTSPTGARIDAAARTDDVVWLDADSYSIVTIRQPVAGSWQFAPGAAHVRIWSQLGIAMSADDTAEAPAVRVELTDAGKAIDERRLAEAVEVTAKLNTQYGTEPLRVSAIDGAVLAYSIDLGGSPLTAADRVTVRVVGKTFERSRVYTERIAHPIDVDIRDAQDGNAGARVRVNVTDMDPASLRVLGSTRTSSGRVKLVVGTKQGDGTWLVAIPKLEQHVDVKLKVLFNLMNNNKIEAESDPIPLMLPLTESLHVGLDIDGHVIVDPVRPPPVVATAVVPETQPQAVVAETPSEAPSEVPDEAPVASPAAIMTEPTPASVAAVAQSRAPAWWEWIAMAGVAVASIGLLAWLLLRSRGAAHSSAFDAALTRYRETLTAASGKPASAATT